MRCLYCGQELEPNATTCGRCGADLSSGKLMRSLVKTLLLAAVSITVIAVIIYVILYWHETQVLAMV